MKRWVGLMAVVVVGIVGGHAALDALGALSLNFDGLGDGFSGPAGTMTVTMAPPDPSGDVGPNHYVQAVNAQLAVFDKSGVALLGPVPVNTLWSGFGGDCETNNGGGATVLYDQMSDRWVVSQMSTPGPEGTTNPYQYCVAVSTTPDPTGAYARYAFPSEFMPIAPTLTAWPDAYYATYLQIGRSGSTSVVCAYDRAQMLSGLPATQQCFGVPGSVLPADLDGSLVPPAGRAYLVSLGADNASLDLRFFHVDWANPANSGVGAPFPLAVSPWSEPSAPSVPQSGGGLLDPVAGRLMRRVAYRRFADNHGAILANHTVAAGTGVGIRWYEIKIPSPLVALAPAVVQQGTWAPDDDWRWVGGLAMDQSGNIGLGYSASSASIKPQLRYTGRLAGDPAGEMTQGEGTIVAGAGAQGAALDRWGSYSSMTVDPADDCTFWFAGEYLPADGTFNWRTRIATFTLPGCGVHDFTIGANPAAIGVQQHATGSTTISTAVASGAAESIVLSIAGVPAGATASFNPPTVSTGASTVLTVDAGSAAPGEYPLTITGTSPSATHDVAVTLTLSPGPDFSMAVTPASRTIAPGSGTTYTVSTTAIEGSTQSIALAVSSGLPSGVTASFSPPTVTAGASSALTLIAAVNAAPATATFHVTGTAAAIVHSADAALTIVSAGTPVPLENGVAVSPLSGTMNSVKYYVLTVPAGASSLTFTLSGGSGDADLYVRRGSLPTTTANDCRATTATNNESCPFSNPQAGDWYAMVRGYSAYSNVTIKGTYVRHDIAVLSNDVAVSGLSGASRTAKYYLLTVPADASSLKFTLTGGSGDADLYVRRGNLPTLTTNDCRSNSSTNNEACTFSYPQAGDWYAMVSGYSSYSNVTIKGTYVLGTGDVLSNGVPVTGVSGTKGSKRVWKLTVPSGQTSLVFKIAGGTGDADLYVQRGAFPTLTSFVCRPFLTGNNETCTIPNPAADDWYVMLHGYTPFSGVTLTGTYSGPATTTDLVNGVPVTGIAGGVGSLKYWKLSVPAGQPKVTFTISGGSGDADLYVRFGAQPTTSTYSCRPYLNGNNETCTMNAPQAGDWHVMIRGYTSYAGVTLTGQY